VATDDQAASSLFVVVGIYLNSARSAGIVMASSMQKELDEDLERIANQRGQTENKSRGKELSSREMAKHLQHKRGPGGGTRAKGERGSRTATEKLNRAKGERGSRTVNRGKEERGSRTAPEKSRAKGERSSRTSTTKVR